MGFSAVLGVVGVGLQMFGAARQAQAQKQQLQAQAAQQREQAKIAAQQEHDAKVNAALAKLNAGAISKQGIQAAQDHGLRISQTVGTARAIIASNGVVLDQPGTSGQAMVDDLIRAGAMDVTRIYQQSEAEQQRALQQEQNFTAQANLFDMQEGALYKTAAHTQQQAGMISPGLAALTAGVGGLSSMSNLLFPSSGSLMA